MPLWSTLTILPEGGWRPIVLFAKSAQNRRHGQIEDPLEMERQNELAVYEGAPIAWLESVANTGVHAGVQRGLPYLNGMVKRDVSGRVVLGDGARLLDWPGVEIVVPSRTGYGVTSTVPPNALELGSQRL